MVTVVNVCHYFIVSTLHSVVVPKCIEEDQCQRQFPHHHGLEEHELQHAEEERYDRGLDQERHNEEWQDSLHQFFLLPSTCERKHNNEL